MPAEVPAVGPQMHSSSELLKMSGGCVEKIAGLGLAVLTIGIICWGIKTMFKGIMGQR